MSSGGRGWVKVVLAIALAASACSGSDKAGGPGEAIELVMVNYDSGGGLRTAPVAAHFVERVTALSGGDLVVRVEAGDWATDGREVDEVAAGEYDLGWVGSRVFDTKGVLELSPLQAPFLIDSYELQAEVLGSSLPRQMLEGLGRVGVTGLAVFADGLRFPASARRPLRNPAEFAGAGIWLLDSNIQAEGIAMIGGHAEPTVDPRQALYDGGIEAIETMWIYYALGADYLFAPFVVPNVVLSPRSTVLFGNPDRLAGLSAEQRGWIRQAADDAVAWSIEQAGAEDPGYIEDACVAGAKVAFATEGDLLALRGAIEPLYARLRTDGATSAAMTAIEAMRDDIGDTALADVPADCLFTPQDGVRPAEQPLTGPGDPGALPPGTYRYRLSADDLPEVVADRGPGPGVFTWTLSGGAWSLVTNPDDADLAPVECSGFYAVDRAIVTFTDPQTDSTLEHCLPPVWTVRWAYRDGDIAWGPPSVEALKPYFTWYPWEPLD